MKVHRGKCKGRVLKLTQLRKGKEGNVKWNEVEKEEKKIGVKAKGINSRPEEMANVMDI